MGYSGKKFSRWKLFLSLVRLAVLRHGPDYERLFLCPAPFEAVPLSATKEHIVFVDKMTENEPGCLDVFALVLLCLGILCLFVPGPTWYSICAVIVVVCALATLFGSWILYRTLWLLTFDAVEAKVFLTKRTLRSRQWSEPLANAVIHISEVYFADSFYGHALWIEVDGERFVFGCHREHVNLVNMYEKHLRGTQRPLVEREPLAGVFNIQLTND